MTISTEKTKITLQVSQILFDRLNEETGFLGLYCCKAVNLEGQQINTRTDLLRFIVEKFFQRCSSQGIPEVVELEGEKGAIPFMLRGEETAQWDAAVLATGHSYDELAERALYGYFLQQGNVFESLAEEFEFFAQKYRGDHGH